MSGYYSQSPSSSRILNFSPPLTKLTFHKDYITFLANVSASYEPTTYHEYKTDPNWVEAMQKELLALEKKSYLGDH